jgi:tripartite-type tricarboxylate transporter receptor subunit TctC
VVSKHRLAVIGLIGSMVGVLAAYPARAEEYPSRVITMIVPYPAGGPTDLISRVVANIISKELGQPIIIESVSGASGTIGAARVARATPDGYTLLMHNMTFASAPGLYQNRTYDPIKDFEPVGLVSDSPQAIVAKKTMAARDLKELVATIKDKPSSINLADAGRGSGSFLCNMLFSHTIGAAMTAVSYRGTGPALNDMLGGQVDLMCDQVANTIEQIKADNIKAYCVATKTRLQILPSVPTCEESGVAGLEASVWMALLAPKGTPRDITAKLSAALQVALKDESVVQRLAGLATVPAPQSEQTPEGLQAFLKSEVDRWRQTLAAMKVSPQ